MFFGKRIFFVNDACIKSNKFMVIPLCLVSWRIWKSIKCVFAVLAIIR